MGDESSRPLFLTIFTRWPQSSSLFFLSDEIHGNSTIEESQIKSIYGVGSTTAGSSRIALSRGRAGGDEARRPLDSSGRRRGECAGGVVRRGTPGSGGAGAPLPGIGAADRAE